jgi:hypothetical protein
MTSFTVRKHFEISWKLHFELFKEQQKIKWYVQEKSRATHFCVIQFVDRHTLQLLFVLRLKPHSKIYVVHLKHFFRTTTLYEFLNSLSKIGNLNEFLFCPINIFSFWENFKSSIIKFWIWILNWIEWWVIDFNYFFVLATDEKKYFCTVPMCKSVCIFQNGSCTHRHTKRNCGYTFPSTHPSL